MKVGFFGGKFLPLHLGHIHTISHAYKSVDKLYVVLSSGTEDIATCQKDNVKNISPDIRLSWLGELVADKFPNAEILHIECNEPEHNWVRGSEQIKQKIHEKITHVFSSEPSYSERFKHLYPNAKHVVVDADRAYFDISATRIRKNLFKHWDMLAHESRSFFIKKIAVVGTESCGKSTITKELSNHYNAVMVPEIGRIYCDIYNNQLTAEMFDDIAMEHWIEQQNVSRSGNKLMFVDSDAVITKYYFGMYKNISPTPLIEAIINKQNYDLVIYLEPDVPWVEDGIRFLSENRWSNNDKLKKMYEHHNIDCISVSGNYDERFKESVRLVDSLVKKTCE
jgi:HTH-type transcriptional repressor of NAD biosynthesis genes